MTPLVLKEKIQTILNKPFKMSSGSEFVFGYANNVYFLEDTRTGDVISTIFFDSLGATCIAKGNQNNIVFFKWSELEALVKHKPVTV